MHDNYYSRLMRGNYYTRLMRGNYYNHYRVISMTITTAVNTAFNVTVYSHNQYDVSYSYSWHTFNGLF
jgi:hypothetical protein